MLKTVLLLLLLLLTELIWLPASVFAVKVPSNRVRTAVGSPAPIPEENAEGLAKAAFDLFLAYADCAPGAAMKSDPSKIPGSTAGTAATRSCLVKQLEAKYPQTIAAFIDRYDGSQGRSSAIVGGCVQCVGFVALAVSLFTGDPAPFYGGDASSFTRYNSFTFKNVIYEAFTPSKDFPIQSGDIGVSPNGSNGHILIVNTPLGPEFNRFTAYESNWSALVPGCHATNFQEHNRIAEGLVFFRLKTLQ